MNVIVTQDEARQIADLLNKRNELTVRYTSDRVLKEAGSYRWRLSDQGEVIACVEIKSVQWYQAEVLHLTVAEAHEGRGHGKALLCEAERAARSQRARVLQCTIRADNDRSCRLFEAFGFNRVSVFHNEQSGNNVTVFQKVLEPAR